MTRYEDQPKDRHPVDVDQDESPARTWPLLVGLLAESELVCETLARWLLNTVDSCDLSRFATAHAVAARIAAGTRFDLVVIGDFLSMARGQNLTTAARIISGAGGGCPIIVVSAAPGLRLQRELLDCGVRGHISTRMPVSAAAEAVRLVLAGGTYAQADGSTFTEPRGHDSEPTVGAGVGRPRDVAAALVRQKLSPRELQALSLLELGYSNRRISAEMGISENTVMVHLRHLMRKLGATNRTQAVFKANCLIAEPGAQPDL